MKIEKNGVFQKTIGRTGKIEGLGLFLGKEAQVYLSPAAENSGIHFYKNGVSLGVVGRDPALRSGGDVGRCSAIGATGRQVLTVEHFLAAMAGLGICNIHVDVHGEEIPILDGSALPFVQYLKSLGIVEQGASQPVYRVTEPLFCFEPARAIALYPSDRFQVSFVLDYDYPYLKSQKVDFPLTAETFETEIAPARTFCTAEEAEQLKSRHLGLGATSENNIVVTQDGSHRNGLRYPDECARHKALDVIGDLALLGFPLQARVVALRSGHGLNRQMVEAILKQKEGHG